MGEQKYIKNPFSFFQFHLLFILADGQMEDPDPTLEALVEASRYPISIVMIGVGGLMEDCDDLLPSRKFDNFQVKMGSFRMNHPRPLFRLFLSFQLYKQTLYFLQHINGKMSIQYIVQGFEPTTFGT